MTGFKWRWIIPIIGLFFVQQWSEWVFSGIDMKIKIKRNNIIYYGFILIQVFSYFTVLMYIVHL